MMRVLLDTDVILDVFLKREPFAENALIRFETRQLNQVARRIAEHHPARAGILLDAPRQFKAVRAVYL